MKEAEGAMVKEELERKFDSVKAEVESEVDTFKRMTMNLRESLQDASNDDKRSEWVKVVSEFKLLKNKFVHLVSIDSSRDVTEVNQKFVNDAETVFLETQTWMLPQLKDAPITSGGSSQTYSTKKEYVRLPSFQGEDKSSPFLKFPVWKSQWDVLIEEYEEKWRSGLLLDHLDDTACSKLVGYETDYAEAIKRLNLFYGDPLKVVSCVMREVMLPHPIADGDYKGLLSYSVILENNYNRLKSINLEHEVSNTSAMSAILKKFPRTVAEKWNENLSIKSVVEKAKPFPLFIKWLESQKEIWERMAASDVGKKCGASNASRFGGSYFVDDAGERDKRCFSCGEEGHLRRNCPKKRGNEDNKKTRRTPKVKKFWCALHKGDPSKKCYSDSCQELRRMDPAERIKLLKENGDCVHCVGDHKSVDCRRKERVCGGNKEDRGCSKSHNAHELFCLQAKIFSVQSMGVEDDSEGVVLSIMQVKGARKGVVASVFWDLGCTSNFVRDDFAKLCGFKGRKEDLSVTTLGGVVSDMSVITYKCSLRDVNGNLEFFEAYGMDTITGTLSKISPSRIRKLFPHVSDESIRSLLRGDCVDVLIGISHPSWHPERVEKAKGGGDFWLYRGKFGACVGGRYQGMKEGTHRSKSLFSVNQSFHIVSHPLLPDQSVSHELEYCPKRVNKSNSGGSEAHAGDCVVSVSDSSGVDYGVPVPDPSCFDCNISVVNTHHEPNHENISGSVLVPCVEGGRGPRVSDEVICFGTKASVMNHEQLFFESESLGTVVEPRCGGCKCSKCPVPGSKFSFKEQREFDIINDNLFRVNGVNRWFTEYPWNCARSVLPRNDKTALQNLNSLEKNLAKNPELAEDFSKQIDEMLIRGVAVVLSDEELAGWSGDYYYLPMVGVKGKKKWLRVCFDASRSQRGHPSLNDCLLKGPDRFVSNLLSVILGFRNGRVGAAADISKFHNQVHLTDKDMHMQRFLWRKMEKDVPPLSYAVKVNNFGVKPANSIATCALHKSADHFRDVYPIESQEIKDQTYIDDELVASVTLEDVKLKTKRMDEICEHAGMPNKGWTYSGEDASGVAIGDTGEEKVLGISWVPVSDMFTFHVVLRFVEGSHEVVVVTEDEFVRIVDSLKLTRRVLLANVARVFDPVGFLCPVILQSKLLMRESWCGKIVGWDEVLPDDQIKRWVAFLSSLLQLKDIWFHRSLWPEEEVVGLPSLIVFSDGAALAFGAVAYIRWQLKRGGYWTRLIMAKCKIAPKGMVSIPRMELNGAVVGNRVKNFLLKETNLKFGKVFQLVDSSTVLGYVQKECGKFRPYEGIRVAEIQSSNKLENGRLVGWAWVSGDVNPADWCTKPRQVKDLMGGFWENGPDFLSQDEAFWPIKFSYKKEILEGEIRIPKGIYSVHTAVQSDVLDRLVNRYSSWKKIMRILARMLRLLKGEPSEQVQLSAVEVKEAKARLIKFAQKGMVKELQEAWDKGTGRYRKLAPMVDEAGVWRVGSRLKNFVPFTFDAKMPILLPPDHRITLLIMQTSHQFSHLGQDGTLSRFRAQGFWTIRAGHLAKKVKSHCVPCRKNDPKTRLNQPMGDFSPEMLKNPVAWGCCQMDLFGPFYCRGDVNPRTTKKTWGMVIEDVNSGAVHLDIVQDYSAESVLLSMRRFGSLRGWPGVVHSDPGSQLVSASGKLVSWWEDVGSPVREFATSKNFEWKVSPPDSPWRQGKAERRIAIVKRLIRLSIGESRITPIELQTVLFETASICNERPICLTKPREDGSYDLITPNNLLIGRSCNVLPDDATVVEDLPIASRYRLVHHITSMFWKKWSMEVSPGLVIRQKWHKKSRNLQAGDLVMLCEHSLIKSKYKLGVVDSIHKSEDGFVRSATIRYVNIQKNPSGDDKVSFVYVKRSVQRLVLILPVEEQSAPVEVEDHELFVKCRSIVKAGV